MGFWSDLSGKIKTALEGQGTPMAPSIKELRMQALASVRDATNPANHEELLAAGVRGAQINGGMYDDRLRDFHQSRVQQVHKLRDATNPADPELLQAAQMQASRLLKSPIPMEALTAEPQKPVEKKSNLQTALDNTTASFSAQPDISAAVNTLRAGMSGGSPSAPAGSTPPSQRSRG